MQLRPDGLLGHGGRYGRAARTRQIEEGRRAAAPVAAEPLTDGLGAAAQARGGLRDGNMLARPQHHPGAHRDAPDRLARQVGEGLTLSFGCNSDKEHGRDLGCKAGYFAVRYHTGSGRRKSAPNFSNVT
jgi:hypothetical protein